MVTHVDNRLILRPPANGTNSGLFTMRAMDKTCLSVTEIGSELPKKIDLRREKVVSPDENSATKTGTEIAEQSLTNDSFSTSWQQWAAVTTLHGVKVVLDTRESFVKRILRLVCLCAFCGVLVYLCYVQATRYLQYNTITKQTIVFEEKIEFPAVTFCNQEIVRLEKKLNYFNDLALRYLYGWPRTEIHPWYLKQVTGLRSMITDDITDVEDIFSLCFFGRREFQCSRLLTSTYTMFGKCFTFNAANDTEQLSTTVTGSDYGLILQAYLNQSIFRLSFDESIGLKVLVHPQTEKPDMTQALSLSPGFTHYIAITKQKFTYLPSPVKAFNTKECIDTDANDFVSPLKCFSQYSRSACLEECLMLYVNSTCGCIGPFHAVTDIEDFPECSAYGYVDCVEPAISDFASLSVCDCPIPCHYSHFETKVSSALFPSKRTEGNEKGADGFRLLDYDVVRENILRVRIYFENKIVKVNEQVLEYEFADLLGSVGRYLGLAVGASLFTILEILEQVVIGCCKLYNKPPKVEPSE